MISDHKAATFALNTHQHPLPKKTIAYRELQKINMNEFKKDILNNEYLNGSHLKNEQDHVKCVEVYETAIRCPIDKHAPEKMKDLTVQPKAEWYAQAVDKAKQEKREWERQWQATGLTIHKEIFSAAKDALTKFITASKRDFLTK